MAIFGLNILSGSSSSYDAFYIFPVIFAAWWGQFPLGVFVSLEVAALGVVARGQEWIGSSSGIHLQDEIVRSCFYLLVCSLVCRFRQTVYQERARARTDSLTGAANGRVFYEVLNAEIDRFSTSEKPFTLAYLDVDNFKKINDQLGHAAGDEILKVIVETILKNTRRNGDTIARMGGDEFALILSETPADNAQHILEKLRQKLLTKMAQRGWPVTFSIGAMNFCKIPGDVEVLIQKVDALMYSVKRNGRNQLCFEVFQENDELNQTALERRASIRVTCTRSIRINTLEAGRQNSWSAKTLDISATGILFHSEQEFPKGTVILIAPLGPLAGVLAKVARTIKETDGWLHGCQLAQSLRMEDLQNWLEPGGNARPRKQAVRGW
jgi:diguanylate cyclase (GGDEF)-like protein